MTEPPIVYIRHGETDWNLNGLIQGSIDTDLNGTGQKQAISLAQCLSRIANAFHGYDLYVSPQKRARQTMAPIAHALGRSMSDVRIEPRVRELAFGIWEGKPFWELKASPVYPAHPEERFYWRPEGGESYEDGVARVKSWRTELARPALVVAHGAVGRCLMGSVAGLGPRELVELKTPQGRWCKLECNGFEWFDAHGDHG